MNVVILDLDKTLVHSIHIPDDDSFDKDEWYGDNGTLIRHGYITFKRPSADVFIRWCFRKFSKIIVWSAGSRDYVCEILSKLFSEFTFDLILTREHCLQSVLKDFSNPTIKTLFKTYDINIKRRGCNMYFIDDKVHQIFNHYNVELLKIKPFESKWLQLIEKKKKRKRPVRECDESLLDIRAKIVMRQR